MNRLDQGQMYPSDQQTTIEDRYYNSQNFENEYPINDPEVSHAATKIQAQFRGHKARRNLEKIKQESQQINEDDQYQKPLSLPISELKQEENKQYKGFEEEEVSEEEKRQLERAALSIQAQFRGFQVRKSLRDTSDNTNEQNDSYYKQQQQEYDNNHDKTSTLSSNRISDHHDLGENLRLHHEIEVEKSNDIDQPHIEREPTSSSQDFERHQGILHDSNFNREQQGDSFNDDDDMSDPNLDKAATRIQASYRGYKIRKELGSPTGGHPNMGHDQQNPSSTSPETHKEYDNALNKNILSPSAEDNKVPEEHEEEEDNAAAVKIQAAYRGYRARKDLEK
ncbi:unnamed protein product [Rotaria magnacalcarata]|uniref:Uncharacterized protein n=1 Tax=Rotaria magnacalcarata TaxID=392030 RepID=A0A816VB25_9BILA|nr:unnamed protein product [Rotaria magnacalcarata]CAF4120271.1 unnamed protein product [Rotaria magnacalcarata]